jgi:hypothetical protein
MQAGGTFLCILILAGLGMGTSGENDGFCFFKTERLFLVRWAQYYQARLS